MYSSSSPLQSLTLSSPSPFYELNNLALESLQFGLKFPQPAQPPSNFIFFKIQNIWLASSSPSRYPSLCQGSNSEKKNRQSRVKQRPRGQRPDTWTSKEPNNSHQWEISALRSDRSSDVRSTRKQTKINSINSKTGYKIKGTIWWVLQYALELISVKNRITRIKKKQWYKSQKY